MDLGCYEVAGMKVVDMSGCYSTEKVGAEAEAVDKLDSVSQMALKVEVEQKRKLEEVARRNCIRC